MLHYSMGEIKRSISIQFSYKINALARDRNVAWCTVSLIFLRPFTKSETDWKVIIKYSEHEHPEFKHVLPCFQEIQMCEITRVITFHDASLEEELIAACLPTGL